MLKRIGKKLINNLGLKILALLSALVMWMVVANIDDPMIKRPYKTSVLPTNEDYITSQGKYYEWLDGDNTVSFNVSAKRNVHEKLSNADFSATADLEKIVYDEKSGMWRVPISISTSKYSGDQVEISSREQYMDVMLEDLGTCQKAIAANTRGTVADGCALGDLQIVGSNLLKVSGPASIVSQIDTVSATINVDGMSSDVTDSVIPVLYDKEGEVIDTSKLTLSLNTVTVSAQILNTKDVQLEFATTGEAADGYVMTDVTYTPGTVRIKGKTAVLNPLNKITVPEEVLDITGIRENLVTTVDISSYLPSGTSLVLNSDAKVEVTVHVEPVITRVLELPTQGIPIQNLREGYRASYDAATIPVEVRGAQSEMEGLTAADLTGSADAGNLGAGEHILEVTLEVNREQCWIGLPVTVPATIERDPDAPAGGNNTLSGNGTSSGGNNTPSGDGTSSGGNNTQPGDGTSSGENGTGTADSAQSGDAASQGNNAPADDAGAAGSPHAGDGAPADGAGE